MSITSEHGRGFIGSVPGGHDIDRGPSLLRTWLRATPSLPVVRSSGDLRDRHLDRAFTPRSEPKCPDHRDGLVCGDPMISEIEKAEGVETSDVIDRVTGAPGKRSGLAPLPAPMQAAAVTACAQEPAADLPHPT